MIGSIPSVTSTGSSGTRRGGRKKSVKPGASIKAGGGGRKAAGPVSREKTEPIRSWTFAPKPKFTRCFSADKYFMVERIKEPAMSILEYVSDLVIVAYLPGVEEKEDIQLKIHGDILEISARGKDTSGVKKYAKEMLLPFMVDPGKIKTHFQNNILEIKLREKKDTKKKRRKDEKENSDRGR